MRWLGDKLLGFVLCLQFGKAHPGSNLEFVMAPSHSMDASTHVCVGNRWTHSYRPRFAIRNTWVSSGEKIHTRLSHCPISSRGFYSLLLYLSQHDTVKTIVPQSEKKNFFWQLPFQQFDNRTEKKTLSLPNYASLFLNRQERIPSSLSNDLFLFIEL